MYTTTNLLDSEQSTVSTFGQIFTPHPKEQSNRNMESTYPSSGETPAYKLFWWPWNAF